MKDISYIMRQQAIVYDERKSVKISSLRNEIYRRINVIRDNKLDYKFRVTLSMMIPYLYDRFLAFEYGIKNRNYLSFEGDTEKLIDEIKENYEKLANFVGQARLYESYAKRLSLDINNIRSDSPSIGLTGGLNRIYDALKVCKLILQFQLEWEKLNKQLLLYNSFFLKEIDMNQYEFYFMNLTDFLKYFNTSYPENDSVKIFSKRVAHYAYQIPALRYLRSTNFKKHHYDKLSKILLCKDILDVQGIDKMIFLNIMGALEQIAEVSETARQENLIRTQIEKHVELLDGFKFGFDLQNRIINYENILSDLTDIGIELRNFLTNRYSSLFLAHLRVLIRNIELLTKNLESLERIQLRWVATRPILSIPEINKVIPNEYDRFKKLNERLLQLYHHLSVTSDVVHNLIFRNISEQAEHSLLPELTEHDQELDVISLSLEKFVNLKRQAYNRFWLLSDDQVLRVLSKGHDLPAIMPLVTLMFGNIVELKVTEELKDENPKIFCLTSVEGEKLPISEIKYVESAADVWLGELDEKIKYYVLNDVNTYGETILNLQEYELLLQAIEKFMGQSSVVNVNIIFTNSVEEVLQERDQVLGYEMLGEEIMFLVEFLTDEMKNVKDRLLRLKLSNLLSALLANHNFCKRLSDDDVFSPADFLWQSHLKWVLDEGRLMEKVSVVQMGIAIPYGYEYVGCYQRLSTSAESVSTSIAINTSRILKNFSVVNGQKVSESIAEFANFVGLHWKVAVSSSYTESMRLAFELKGCTVMGHTIMIEAVDQLEVRTLAVLTHFVLEVRQALDSNSNKVSLYKDKIFLNKKFHCVYIPLSQDFYKAMDGRFKSYFNYYVYVKPKVEVLLETRFFMNGFKRSRDISRRVTTLFDLLHFNSVDPESAAFTRLNDQVVNYLIEVGGSQLNRLDSYKYANRGSLYNEWSAVNYALLSFFSSCNNSYIKNLANKLVSNIIDEKVAMARQHQKNTIKKQRAKILKEILEDESKFIYNKYLYQRAEQLIKSFENEHLKLVVGKTKTFKHTLLNSAIRYHQLVSDVVISSSYLNSNLVTKKQMFGYYDSNHKYVEGLMTQKLLPNFMGVNNLSSSKVETLNRKHSHASMVEYEEYDHDYSLVVADNLPEEETFRLMHQTLKSKSATPTEGVQLKTYMIMCDSTINLSPTSIAQSNLVYFDGEIIGIDYYIELRINSLVSQGMNSEYADILAEKLYPTYKQIMTNMTRVIEIPDHLELWMIFEFVELLIKGLNLEYNNLTKSWVQHLIAYTLLHIVGIMTPTSEYLSSSCTSKLGRVMGELPECNVKMEHLKDLIIENKEWRDKTMPNLTTMVPKFEFNSTIPLYEILVPTQSSFKNSYNLSLFNKARYPAAVFGEYEVGKTVLVRNYLFKNKDSSNLSPIWINYFAHMTNSELASRMVKSLYELRKNLFSCSSEKRLAYIVDDLYTGASADAALLDFLRHFLRYSNILVADGKCFQLTYQWMVLVDGAALSLLSRDLRLLGRLMPLKVYEMKHSERSTIYKKYVKRYLMYHAFAANLINLNEEICALQYKAYRSWSKYLKQRAVLFRPNFSNLMMVGDLTFQLKNIWVENEEWLHGFQNLEFNRVFKDRIDPYSNCAEYAEYLKVTEDLQGEESNLVLSEVFAVNLSFYDLDKFRVHIERSLKEYNSNYSDKLNLTLTVSMVKNFYKVTRGLKLKSRQLLLIGDSGAGRRSIVRLCSYCFKRFRLELVGTNEDSYQLHKELSTLYVRSINDPILLLLEEHNLLAQNKFYYLYDLICYQNPYYLMDMDFFERVKTALMQNDPDYRGFTTESVYSDFRTRLLNNLKIALVTSNLVVVKDLVQNLPAISKNMYVCYLRDLTPDGNEEFTHCNMRHTLKMFPFVNKTINLWTKINDLCILWSKEKQFPYRVGHLVDCIELFKRRVLSRYNDILHNAHYSKNAIEVFEIIDYMIERENSKTASIRLHIKEQENKVNLLKHQVDTQLQKAEQNSRDLKEAQNSAAEIRIECNLRQEDYDSFIRRGFSQFEHGVKYLKKITSLMVHSLRSAVHLSEDAKKVVYSAIHLADESFVRYDWGLACLRLNGSPFVTQLMEKKVEKIPRTSLLRLRNLITEQSEEFALTMKNRNETVYLLLQWLYGILDYWRNEDEAKPTWQTIQTLQAKLASLDRSMAEWKANINNTEHIVTLYTQEYKAVEASISQELEILEKVSSKIGICEALNELKLNHFEMWNRMAQSFEYAQRYFLGHTLIDSVLDTICGPMNSSMQTEFLESLYKYLIQVEIEFDPKYVVTETPKEKAYIESLLSRKVPICNYSIKKLRIYEHSVRFVFYVDPEKIAYAFFKDLADENLVVLANYDTVLGPKANPDALRMYIGSFLPIVLYDAPMHPSPDARQLLGYSRKFSLLESVNVPASFKGANILLGKKNKLILLHPGEDAQVSPDIFDICQVVNIQLSAKALTQHINETLFQNFAALKYAKWLECLQNLEFQTSLQNDQTLDLYNLLGEKIDRIVESPELNNRMAQLHQDYHQSSESLKNLNHEYNLLLSLRDKYSKAANELAESFRVLYKIKYLDEKYSFSLEIFMKILSEFVQIMTDNALGFGESFCPGFYRQVLQMLMPQMMHGHKEILSFLLLSCKSKYEKDSDNFETKRIASILDHKFNKVMDVIVPDRLLANCRNHVSSLSYFVRQTNLINLKYQHLKGENISIRTKTINLNRHRKSQDEQQIRDADLPYRRYSSGSDLSHATPSAESMDFDEQDEQDLDPESYIQREKAYELSRLRAGEGAEATYDINKLEWHYRHFYKYEAQSLLIYDSVTASYFADSAVTLMMKKIPLQAPTRPQTSPDPIREDHPRLSILSKHSKMDDIKESVSSYSESIANADKSDITSSKSSNHSSQEHQKGAYHLLNQEEVRKFSQNAITLQNQTTLEHQNSLSQTQEDSESAWKGETITKQYDNFDYKVRTEQEYTQYSDFNTYNLMYKIELNLLSTSLVLYEKYSLNIIEGVTHDLLHQFMKMTSCSWKELKAMFGFKNEQLLDIIYFVKIAKPQMLAEIFRYFLAKEYEIEEWTKFTSDCTKNFNNKTWPRTFLFSSYQEEVPNYVEKLSQPIIYDPNIEEFYTKNLSEAIDEDRKILVLLSSDEGVERANEIYQTLIKQSRRQSNKLKSYIFFNLYFDSLIKPSLYHSDQFTNNPISLKDFNIIYNYFESNIKPLKKEYNPLKRVSNRLYLQSSAQSHLDLMIRQTNIYQYEIGSTEFLVALVILSLNLICKTYRQSFCIGVPCDFSYSCGKFLQLFSNMKITRKTNLAGLGYFLNRLLLFDHYDNHQQYVLNSIVTKLTRFHLVQVETNPTLLSVAGAASDPAQPKEPAKAHRRLSERFLGQADLNQRKEAVQKYIQTYFFDLSFYRNLFGLNLEKSHTYLNNDILYSPKIYEGLETIRIAPDIAEYNIGLQVVKPVAVSKLCRYLNIIMNIALVDKDVDKELDNNFKPEEPEDMEDKEELEQDSLNETKTTHMHDTITNLPHTHHPRTEDPNDSEYNESAYAKPKRNEARRDERGSLKLRKSLMYTESNRPRLSRLGSRSIQRDSVKGGTNTVQSDSVHETSEVKKNTDNLNQPSTDQHRQRYKYSLDYLNRDPYYHWLLSEADDFNSRLTQLKEWSGRLLQRVQAACPLSKEEAEVVRQVEAQLTPLQLQVFFAYSLDLQHYITQVLKSRNHLQKLLRYPWRRVIRVSALLNPAELFSALKLGFVLAQSNFNFKQLLFFQATSTSYQKASKLYEDLSPTNSGPNKFYLKGALLLNAHFDQQLRVSRREHSIVRTNILEISITPRNEWLMWNIRRNLMAKMKNQPWHVDRRVSTAADATLVYNCPVYLQSKDMLQSNYFHINAKGELDEYVFRGVCIKLHNL